MSNANLKKYEYMLNYGRKLQIYLFENRIKQKNFAIEIDVHPTTVSDSWIKRNLQPKLENAYKIHDYTDGVISLEEMGY